MFRMFHDTHFPFLRYRKAAYIGSGVVVLATIASIVAHGGLRYSIDFTGGTLVQLDFEQPVDVQTLRAALRDMEGLESFEVQRFGDPSDVVIRAQVPAGQEEEFGGRIEEHLRRALPDRPFTEVRSEAVGPKIGEELKQRALLAILYALGLILVYVAFRFDIKFGVAAIAATVHDIVFALGAFSLANKEISLAVVAAFLTIVGYSLNDTIVVFDRIREDLKTMRRAPYDEIVNTAVNQTLSRTIITAGTTLVVLVFLYVLGGEVIRDFAYALIIGIAVGTYSSVFVGSAILVDWKRYIEDPREKKTPRGPARARTGSRS
jgi:preprotein translocase SecF subunit